MTSSLERKKKYVSLITTKATKRLERVYIDLHGPMAVMSRASNLYSMNMIDDFSGYI